MIVDVSSKNSANSFLIRLTPGKDAKESVIMTNSRKKRICMKNPKISVNFEFDCVLELVRFHWHLIAMLFFTFAFSLLAGLAMILGSYLRVYLCCLAYNYCNRRLLTQQLNKSSSHQRQRNSDTQRANKAVFDQWICIVYNTIVLEA